MGVSRGSKLSEKQRDDDDSGGGGNDVELEEVDDDDGGSGEVRSQLGGLDCSLPPPIKAQLGEVPVVYALLWLLDSAAFKVLG
ncbi:hypothetical protein CsSME_00019373 [Camellia sinensis var. sinensis]